MRHYGKECIIDLLGCNFPTRESINSFCINVCALLGMQREDLHFWDYEPEAYKEAPPHLKGISAVQFITTSSIVIHSLDERKRVYLNIFSCKDFDGEAVRDFVLRWTGGTLEQFLVIDRK